LKYWGLCLLFLWLGLPGWGVPEVDFHVDPPGARIYYRATSVDLSGSGGAKDELLPLDGDGRQGRALKLRPEFLSSGRDSFTLLFKDPDGLYEDYEQQFKKYEFAEGRNLWPKSGTFALPAIGLRGQFDRLKRQHSWVLWLAGLAALGTVASLIVTWKRSKEA
jgi:hypothetical protein